MFLFAVVSYPLLVYLPWIDASTGEANVFWRAPKDVDVVSILVLTTSFGSISDARVGMI